MNGFRAWVASDQALASAMASARKDERARILREIEPVLTEMRRSKAGTAEVVDGEWFLHNADRIEKALQGGGTRASLSPRTTCRRGAMPDASTLDRLEGMAAIVNGETDKDPDYIDGLDYDQELERAAPNLIAVARAAQEVSVAAMRFVDALRAYNAIPAGASIDAYGDRSSEFIDAEDALCRAVDLDREQHPERAVKGGDDA